MELEDVRFKAKIKDSNILVSVIKIDFSEKKVHIGIDKDLWEDNPEDIEFPHFMNDFENVEALLPYTGFKDKKRKKIYEYDLINVDGYLYMVKYWNGEFLLVDVFPQPIEDYDDNFDENNTFERHLKIVLENQYKSPHTDFRGFIPWVYDDKMTFEIIGNCFENPELLKKES